MDVVFADDDLDRLETDAAFTMGLPAAVVTAYRRRMQSIRAAVDERDLRVVPSWHFEKLQGKRFHQHSLRLNDQYRLVFELDVGPTGKRVRIASIEDYH
jgi:proteic killer suppression protein